MKFRADITTCEDERDKILSVCQVGSDGEIEHEVIIQRGPKEFDIIDDDPGPKISCEYLGLDIAPGPKTINFSEDAMTIVLDGPENIQVDLSPLSPEQRSELEVVAKVIFK